MIEALVTFVLHHGLGAKVNGVSTAVRMGRVSTAVVEGAAVMKCRITRFQRDRHPLRFVPLAR